jgi:hypothetical protein
MLKTFLTILRHKRFVYRAGRRLGVSRWRLLKHDLSKFSPREFLAYAQQFGPGKERNPSRFAAAWLHHVQHNDHHWEHWVLPQPGKENVSLDMPDQCIREMVADWLGASMAYEGYWPVKGKWRWYTENFKNIQLSSLTRLRAQLYVNQALTPEAR